ncbi:FAD/NAD(P)-binding oxidoreductase [Pseudomonas agarici]|uniref:FAD/NAD(P)-binding oxidoreductase n=1 Tax=Pseudomonas agarici TaxID=46677 RepID=A0A0X1T5X9_PSEAA|nr:FAD/NAD(P)-binding oxidoreductase [Pseudomonas agarici]AMB87507.1 FAD/NAD(P)-binding oxidoreductase [Pseudomonas agarici]NWB90093.1 NAD(P)/FAD-dependent oxidoreductase [Pseudomonas agarici]NWC08126.1 NAD(P)/FAD-dependent oxidoreductase [Pseudomonas agarici]SEK86019.1 NADPH-dependent 2,4-dienoyl-CoA reductase, sulfur reductase [Pseudomonas agarici]
MIDFADLLIIGAGPAGIAAALAAAPSGARIVIIDDNPQVGGQIWRDGPRARLAPQARKLRQRLQARDNVRHYPSTQVIASNGAKRLLLEGPRRSWQIGYDQLILCTGARELLLPFPGWTLPGVTAVGGLQALIKGGLPVSGERLVVAGSGPLLLASAATARHAGARILRVAEQAAWRSVAAFATQLPRWPHKWLQAFALFDPHYRTDSHVIAALGSERLEAVRLEQRGQITELACDRLACGFGLIPNTQLGQALGCALDGLALAVDPWQASSLADHYAAGECCGFGGSELALVEGAIAGHAAVGERDAAQRLWPVRARWQGFADTLNQTFALDPRLKALAKPDTLVCRCEDVTYAALQGHRDWHEAKLASRCGMGACQGRVCGAATRHLFGWQLPAPRPPFSPARIDTLLCLDDTPPV